jgi:hypothetical protein
MNKLRDNIVPVLATLAGASFVYYHTKEKSAMKQWFLTGLGAVGGYLLGSSYESHIENLINRWYSKHQSTIASATHQFTELANKGGKLLKKGSDAMKQQ